MRDTDTLVIGGVDTLRAVALDDRGQRLGGPISVANDIQHGADRLHARVRARAAEPFTGLPA